MLLERLDSVTKCVGTHREPVTFTVVVAGSWMIRTATTLGNRFFKNCRLCAHAIGQLKTKQNAILINVDRLPNDKCKVSGKIQSPSEQSLLSVGVTASVLSAFKDTSLKKFIIRQLEIKIEVMFDERQRQWQKLFGGFPVGASCSLDGKDRLCCWIHDWVVESLEVLKTVKLCPPEGWFRTIGILEKVRVPGWFSRLLLELIAYWK